jgi:hypothetical protein
VSSGKPKYGPQQKAQNMQENNKVKTKNIFKKVIFTPPYEKFTDLIIKDQFVF